MKVKKTTSFFSAFAIFGALIFVAVDSRAVAKSKKSQKPKGAVYAAGRPEIFDWQGQALGRELPEWVNCAVDGDKTGVKKALKLERDMQLFLISRAGDNLDFLKTWADQADARAEVSSSLKTTIAQTVQTVLRAQNVDSETVTRKADLYSAQASNITLNGLQKINSYWIKTRRLKTGVKKAKSDSDYEYKTTYMVVFGIDADVYGKQLKAAMDDVEDNDREAVHLRSALTEKCTDTLGVEAVPVAAEPNSHLAAEKQLAASETLAVPAAGIAMTGDEKRAADLANMTKDVPTKETAASSAAIIPQVIPAYSGARGIVIGDPSEFIYKLNDTNDGMIITGIKKHPSEEYSIIIPREIEGYPVVQVNQMDIGKVSPVCIVFADSVKVIEPGACSGWDELESVLLPSELVDMGSGAFKECKSLKTADVSSAAHESATEKDKSDAKRSIGIYAFEDCKSLKKATLPPSIEIVGDGAFEGCEALEAVEFNEGLAEIGSEAFKGCESLKSVILPSSVATIYNGAFEECTGLESVLLPGGKALIGDEVFKNCSALLSVAIPKGAKLKIRRTAFQGCSSLPLSVQAEIKKGGYHGDF